MLSARHSSYLRPRYGLASAAGTLVGDGAGVHDTDEYCVPLLALAVFKQRGVPERFGTGSMSTRVTGKRALLSSIFQPANVLSWLASRARKGIDILIKRREESNAVDSTGITSLHSAT